MEPDGTINENGGPYRGMDRYAAREAVVEDLRGLGLLEKVTDHLHAVGHCYRCGTEVEPYLSTQWFVRMEPLAREAVEAVREGRIRFTPRRWEKIYFDWMEDIRDWCISRQLWWGHRIPVWYCQSCGEVTAAVEAPEACSCGSTDLEQDPDVLDTWFSSGLWPFSTMGWPEDTPELRVFYPTSVLTTAFDIIFFWVARMIMLGLRFMGDVPFREVFVTALVCDYEGKKMSKSSGNVIDPIDVIDMYGTDALRFTLGSIAVPGRDINLSEKRIEGNLHFANKIWNAARFVLSNLDDYTPDVSPGCEGRELADRWIISRTAKLIARMDSSMDFYNFSVAGKAIYQFLWGDFCDWYLELIKPRIYGEAGPARLYAQDTACRVLDCSLRLLHPFMPFITEELWQMLPGTGESLMVAQWPEASSFELDPVAEQEMEIIQSVVAGIRSARSEHSVNNRSRIEAVLVCEGDARRVVERELHNIAQLARISPVSFAEEPPADGYDIRVVTEGVQAFLASGVDPAREIDRLARRLEKVEADLERCRANLANREFLERAPSVRVEEVRSRFRELSIKREKLAEQMQALRERRRGGS